METIVQVKDLTKLSVHNRLHITEDTDCGCYHCCKVFKGSIITTWIDSNTTALCPYCCVDAVAPNVVNIAFLEWAKGYWFSTHIEVKV